MMARASGAYCSLPASSAERHGDHAQQRRQRGHQDRPQPHLQACTTRLQQRQALLVQDAGELNDQDAVRDDDAGHHDDAHQRHDVERAAGEKQDHTTPARPGGIAIRMMKGSMKEVNCAIRIR